MPSRRRIFLLISLSLAVGVTLFLWSGCGRDPLGYSPDNLPLASTVDDPISAQAGSVDLIAAPDFAFTFGDGSGWHGYNVTKIAADGTCRYSFFNYKAESDADGTAIRRAHWYRTEFTIDAATLAELRTLLRDIDFFRLKKSYHANVMDGTQRFAKVIASGKRKGVYCDNHFPEPFRRLQRFVNERIIQPHAAELASAKEFEFRPEDQEPETFD